MIGEKRDLIKNFVYVALSIVGAVAIGTIMMIAVYCLPIEPIRENVRATVSIYEVENDGYSWAPWVSSTHIDNFTDSIIINNAVFLGTGDVIADAMNNPYVVYADLTTQSEYLSRAVQTDTLEGAGIVNYARYWHGYLIWLKPLLSVFNLSDMRVMSMCFQFTLLLWVLLEIYKKEGVKLAIPFALAILCLNPISTALCIQYSCVYNITLIAALIMLKTKLYSSDKYWYLFLWIGICTSYFDFLTYPIVGLGINLILLLVLKKADLVGDVKTIFYSSFAWGVGYAGMWSGKWLVSYLLTGENTLADALNLAKYRLDGQISTEPISAIEVISYNLHELFGTAYKVMFMIIIISLIVYCLLHKYVVKFNIKKAAVLLVVSMFPIVWYVVLKNHSLIHAWMTHRNYSIMILGVACVISYSLYSRDYEKKDNLVIE